MIGSDRNRKKQTAAVAEDDDEDDDDDDERGLKRKNHDNQHRIHKQRRMRGVNNLPFKFQTKVSRIF